MAAKTSAFVGSGVATVGGEAPVEQCPHEKFCIERDSPLCDSKMWKMLDNYYKKMAIEAWAHDYVPSFVTSNSRLCRSYAKIIINFLQDWFKRPEADPTKPVTILEIGGGHGRFTFLLLRAMKRYQRFFASLGLPERPFLFVFSDVAEANVAFCSKHPALKEFVDMQWLDFAIFDGNKAREVPLVVKGKPLANGAAPVVAICNYVLDSLLTDAWRVTPGAPDSDFERALVSIYSPIEEEQLDAPDIMARMTLGWKWQGVQLDAACDKSSSQGIKYLQSDAQIKDVLLQYRKLNKQLSFVLPIGAFALFQNLLHIGGGRLFCLVGDKGYPTADEFEGARDPHIAIHGSVSFMLNIHAIRSYFECMGGFSHATPYRDTFQVTGINANRTPAPKGRIIFCLYCASADLEGVPTHSSTYINIASCCKVEGDFKAGLKYCEKALQINPHYPQAIQMQRTLHMCINPVRVALIGCGYWALYEALPLLRRDKRFKIAAVFSFKEKEVSTLVEMAELDGVQQYSGSQGLSSLLERDDIQVVVVDVHTQLVILTRGETARFRCCLPEHMALDLLRCLTALRELTGLHLSSISATAVGDHAPCCSQGGLQENVASDRLKDRRQRPEFARLSGWLTFVDANAQIRNGGNSFAVQSIGHQNCHDAFAEDLYDKIFSVSKPIPSDTAKDEPAMVDVSINAALSDSAVIEGILASIQHAGVPARFGCPEASTMPGANLYTVNKKLPTTELDAASCF
ncbi:hypothetical protein ACSSS7_004301 [Eimeria intestinalis]